MTFWNILENLFLGPLKLLFEWIYQLSNQYVNHPGVAIIFLSLIMNILVLPLYKRADAMQEEARDIDQKLNRGVAHIKKTFSGDERMMILQTYYRQNNYKPTDALKGSLSLLLEIPFFMAAYQFLSNLDILQGASLGPIQDLGLPDGLLVIGTLSINILPILMTLINVISCMIYLKGFPLKSKIQLYGMAMFFLVFLYTSPAGLVFYWTLNNVFSLVKTIFYKLKNPQKVLRFLTCALGAGVVVFGSFFYQSEKPAMKVFLIAVGVALLLPMALFLLRSKIKAREVTNEPKPQKRTFLLAGLFLTVLVGIVIPANFISASPQEYVNISYFYHPLWYIVSSLCMAAGTFLVWMSVFYWLAKPSGKVLFERIMWILCGTCLVNYMFFGRKLGFMTPELQYEAGMKFTGWEYILNALVLVAIAAILYFIIAKWKKALPLVLVTAVFAFGIMSTVHIVNIRKQVENISVEQSEGIPNFSLSKEGKNVVVLMLDRGLGLYTPYFFNEDPSLQEQFNGFTYYSNVISHGGFTNFGTPGLFGGYEYTPVEMNKRADESLKDKQNEALKMMPVLFSENGYDVTVCDPTYANYQNYSDTSIFNEYPEISTFVTEGVFVGNDSMDRFISSNNRNFFCFSLMKSMPLFLQPVLYDGGNYNQIQGAWVETEYHIQTVAPGSTTKAQGISATFMNLFSSMTNLPNMTQITDGDQNTFMCMVNNTTHEPILLQVPEYEPAFSVDNTLYDAMHTDRFTLNGKTIEMEEYLQVVHYQTNMAVMQQIGNWLDYLRENDVYDNTRIIIVSDHGRPLYHMDELVVDGEDLNFYFPLLLVKDFDSTEFTVSNEFMTNADVPTLATMGIIENPVNPFTGKVINWNEKTAHDQYIIRSMDWDVNINNGNTFLPAKWAKVSSNFWDLNNWSFYNQEIVLTDHAFPN